MPAFIFFTERADASETELQLCRDVLRAYHVAVADDRLAAELWKSRAEKNDPRNLRFPDRGEN